MYGTQLPSGVQAFGRRDAVRRVQAAGCGGWSEVDILVATPGRLMDHMQHTPGFTLQHLHYLVVDEADRLLTQSYQDWIVKVTAAAYNQQPGVVHFMYVFAARHVYAPYAYTYVCIICVCIQCICMVVDGA